MRSLRLFLKIFFAFNLRQVKHHRGRVIAVIIGIAMGAAVFSSVRIAVRASLDSFSNSLLAITGNAQYTLYQPGGYVPETIIADLIRHPMIAHASPLCSTYVREKGSNSNGFLLIGIDPFLDYPFREWQNQDHPIASAADWRELLTHPNTLLVSATLAETNDWQEGANIELVHARSSAHFRLIGTLFPNGLAIADGGRMAVTDIATFQEFTGRIGRVDRVDVIFSKPVSDADLKVLARILPPGVRGGDVSEIAASGQRMLVAYQLNLSILSFGALFVGMFLVYSLVALNTASRKKEIATLKSLGASSRLIFYLFLAEGALYGLIGWIVAIPICFVVVQTFINGISQTITLLFARVFVTDALPEFWELVTSLVLTVTVATIAAFQPARSTTKVSPLLAMSMETGDRVPFKIVRTSLYGFGFLISVLPLSLLPGPEGVPVFGYLAILVLFIGFACISPVALLTTGRLVSPLLRRFFGMPAFLAGRYIRQGGVRTAVSVGALITAVALYAALVIMIFSFRQTVDTWVRQSVSGDLFVTPKMAAVNRFQEPFTSASEAGLSALADEMGISIVPNRRFLLQTSDIAYQLEAVDFVTYFNHGGLVWIRGQVETARQQLIKGEGVVISEVFANQTGMDIGDVYWAQLQDVLVKRPIVGVVRDYRTQGGIVFCSLAYLKTLFHDLRWGGVRFYFNGSRDGSSSVAQLSRRIIERCGPHLDIIEGTELRASIMEIFDRTFAVTSVLLVIALLVAAIGIATTLTVLVLERQKQLHTLSAIGATIRQLRLMIVWEALLMVIVGATAGLICGFWLAHILIYTINRHSFGWTFVYSINWTGIAAAFPFILATAIFASLPAIRVAFKAAPAALLREN